MSLLLDALKKAALEKQRREQPNSAKALAPDTSAPSTPTTSTMPPAPAEHIPPVAMEVTDTHTSLGSHDLGELNPHAFDEIRVYPSVPDSEPLPTEAVIPHPSLEQPDEGLIFDINEIDQQYLLPPETVEEPASLAEEVVIAEKVVIVEDKSIVDEFVRKASALATPANSSPLAMEPMPDSKVELPPEVTPLQDLKAGLPDSTAPAPITTPVSAPTETPKAKPVDVPSTSAPIPISTPIAAAADDVEAFNVASGKAALAQLLERSKKATGAARKRMVVMYGVLSIIAIVLVLCYYYLLHSSSSLVVAPPSAAPAAEMPVSGEIAEVTPTTDAAAGAAPSTTDGVATPQANLMVEEESSAPSPEQATWAEQTTSAEQTTQAEPSLTPQRPTRRQQRQMEEDYSRNDVSLPPERAIKSAMIVEHKAEENAVSESIARGYKAYQAGDLEGAGAAYRDALEQDPYQRDALLGAAAVAVREGRQTDALTLYQKRLARDPKDEYAQAGILALSASAENPQLESELSRLLLEYPEATHLHFLKGSLYAARQQWAAAQLAFFEAWQRDNKNPDLAFNLAVAMDHLNQPKEAARFYRQAIELGNARPFGFSVDATLHRLQTLEQQHVHEGATP